MAVKNKKESKSPDQIGSITYELFIAALSILSVINVFLLYFVKSEDIAGVVVIMNVVFDLIFLADFSIRFFGNKTKKEYFIHRYGWADLLASLPFPELKILLFFRLLRAVRIMRKYHTKRLVLEFLANRGSSALLTIFFLAILVLEFGGILILHVESFSSAANIKTPSDALWWIIVTITTVGYGDRYPVTNWGRIIGVVVMLVGIGLFGTLSGFLATAFLQPKKK